MAEVPDDATVVLILHADGRAELTVANDVEDAALAEYVRLVAGMIERGEHRDACKVCAQGGTHDHVDQEPAPSGE